MSFLAEVSLARFARRFSAATIGLRPATRRVDKQSLVKPRARVKPQIDEQGLPLPAVDSLSRVVVAWAATPGRTGATDSDRLRPGLLARARVYGVGITEVSRELRELDGLVLACFEDVAEEAGLGRDRRPELARNYLGAVARLGFTDA